MKYPNVTVNLIGKDGNTFAIMANVSRALRQKKVDPEEIKKFQDEAMGGDYNNLLRTCVNWVNVK